MCRSLFSSLASFLFLKYLGSKGTVKVLFFNLTPVSNFWRHSSPTFFQTLFSKLFCSNVSTSHLSHGAEGGLYYMTGSFLPCSAYL